MNVGMHKCNLCFPFPFDSRDVCFVEADTGIYSFFFVGGGGGAAAARPFFSFWEGGEAFCDRGTDCRYLTQNHCR